MLQIWERLGADVLLSYLIWNCAVAGPRYHQGDGIFATLSPCEL
jgi:hypothetical protein